MMKKGEKIMKTTEKIKLMIRLEKGFKKLDLEELNLISKTLENEKKKKLPHDYVNEGLKKPSRW